MNESVNCIAGLWLSPEGVFYSLGFFVLVNGAMTPLMQIWPVIRLSSNWFQIHYYFRFLSMFYRIHMIASAPKMAISIVAFYEYWRQNIIQIVLVHQATSIPGSNKPYYHLFSIPKTIYRKEGGGNNPSSLQYWPKFCLFLTGFLQRPWAL